MLTKVEVRNQGGALLTLTLEDPSNGFVVADIQGLTPVKATLVSSSFAKMDGTQFQSARRESRNIILKLGLEPDYVTTSVRDLRNQLYNFFMTKSQVSLRFFDSEGPTVDIFGRVETCEPALFAQDPQVDISIICFDPDFVELTPIVVSNNTVSDSTEFVITYDGTVETGFLFTLNVDRTLSEFTILNRTPDNVVHSLEFAASLVADDVVTISTVPGSKGVFLTRASTLSSILYAKSPESSWIELVKGDNNIRVSATGSAIPLTIEYTTRHGGL